MANTEEFERVAFERWCDEAPDEKVSNYEIAWIAWQARAALASPSAAPTVKDQLTVGAAPLSVKQKLDLATEHCFEQSNEEWSFHPEGILAFARALSRTAPEDEITNDQCIDLAEHLQRALFEKHLTEVKDLAGGFHEGPFQAGWESALEELETRLAMLPDQTEQILQAASPLSDPEQK